MERKSIKMSNQNINQNKYRWIRALKVFFKKRKRKKEKEKGKNKKGRVQSMTELKCRQTSTPEEEGLLHLQGMNKIIKAELGTCY